MSMRLIDADKILKHTFEDRREPYKQGWDDAIYAIVGYEPTAVEVVFCKDCKWWQKTDKYDGVYGCCEHLGMIIDKPIFVNEDFFCADGERREE